MMNLTKLNPWNWFKHESFSAPEGSQIPVKKETLESVNQQVNQISPFDTLLQLHRDFDQMFDQVWNSFALSPRQSFPRQFLSDSMSTRPALLQGFKANLDVSGDDKQYQIRLDVPSFTEEDLAIDVKDNVLIIKGNKVENQENKDKEFYRVERRTGSFQRTLSVPEDGDIDNIDAELKDGVLTLTIPRLEVSPADAKKIQIKTH